MLKHKRTGQSKVRQCKTCRHWDHDELIDERSWGSCMATRSKNGKPACHGTLAYAVDSDEYSATLVTHEQFMCLQWEEKGDG